MSPSLRKALAVCRAMREEGGDEEMVEGATPTRDQRLDLATVVEVEDALGTALPNDVLALCALGISALDAGLGFRLDDMPACAQEASEQGRSPDGWVTIGTSEPSPFAATGTETDGSSSHELCIRRGAPAEAEPTILVIGDGDLSAARKVPLGALVREQLARQYGERPEWQSVLETAGGYGSADPDIGPEIVGDPQPDEAPRGPRRVRHAKFGLGTVVREDPDGKELKLEIEFDGVGRKLLLARFVEDAEAC